MKPPRQLLDDATAIWLSGLEAVRSERLVCDALRVEGAWLAAGGERIPLDATRRIAVVGAGKAGAGMAAAVERLLGPVLMEQKHVTGWINVPADVIVRPKGTVPFSPCATGSACAGENWDSPRGSASAGTAGRIHLHAARPAGVNEPTPAGAAGAMEILRLVQSLGPDDLCLCLISGGGSALMPAPADGIALDDKLAVTRHLSAAGDIEQLNTVRKQLSRIKGGGLARACRAGRLLTLIISDVLGDPLDLIASGPTVEDSSSPEAALAVLEQFAARDAGISPRVFDHLRRQLASEKPRPACRVTNLVIGNNATAVEAAGREAKRRGYSPATVSAAQSEGPAEEVGRRLADEALAMRAGSGPDCLVSGGEPVVRLVEAARRGLGGRNQQLVLAALERLAWKKGSGAFCLEGPPAGTMLAWSSHKRLLTPFSPGIALLSGGTDGEDGPTDAAGAFFDAATVEAAGRLGLDPAAYLARNDAYHFFEPLDALFKTGPTHTNVCDVRVVVVQAESEQR